MAIGESFDVVDAAGTVQYTITVVGVTVDVACTAPGATAAENGHLVGLQVAVTPVAGETSLDASDFFVVASDGIATAPATAAAAACLTEAETLPAGPLAAGQAYAGTVVLDVAAPSGSIVHRPDPAAAGAVWVF